METDYLLIHQMKQGDSDAFDRFIRKYYPDILKYCYYHSSDRSSAEDLTQEAFLKFFTALPRYRHIGKAKNYLYTIARNLCMNELKKPVEYHLEQVSSVTPLEDVSESLLLDQSVRSLPQELQELIHLHYYQELTVKEAASILGIGLPLAKYRLKRAKELLRKELEGEFE